MSKHSSPLSQQKIAVTWTPSGDERDLILAAWFDRYLAVGPEGNIDGAILDHIEAVKERVEERVPKLFAEELRREFAAHVPDSIVEPGHATSARGTVATA
jgi:hypothetical protein